MVMHRSPKLDQDPKSASVSGKGRQRMQLQPPTLKPRRLSLCAGLLSPVTTQTKDKVTGPMQVAVVRARVARSPTKAPPNQPTMVGSWCAPNPAGTRMANSPSVRRTGVLLLSSFPSLRLSSTMQWRAPLSKLSFISSRSRRKLQLTSSEARAPLTSSC